MAPTHDANQGQSTAWNGASGRAWVELQDLLDRLFKPFEDLLADTLASADRVRHVLDVGCGTGSTTLALSRRLGHAARCVGIDISDPMITLAQARAEREGSWARFVRADAQVHAFDPASFDTFASRFGVMFFDDPVQAFANMRRAATNGAELVFIAWRSALDNPFMTTAERVAAPLLHTLPTRPAGGPSHAPGQFAFADRDHVSELLTQGGWHGIDIQPIDVACTLPEQDLLRYISWLGPVGALLQQADEATRTKVLAAMRPAFDAYVHGSDVRFDAACWMIRARA